MRTAQIEIGLSEFWVLSRRPLKIGNRFLKLTLIEKTQSEIESGLPLLERPSC